VSTPEAAERAPDRVRALHDAGAQVELIEPERSLERALARCAAMGLTSVLVEGGVQLHRAFWDAGLVDRLEVFQTGAVLGPGRLPWLPLSVLDSDRIVERSTLALGEDRVIEAYVYRPD
jgi:diaminohydroxyphosphoribosylaminopyrimidine deaminase/5-amino-6-(5-phosphoribosylamino)uracil reductase